MRVLVMSLIACSACAGGPHARLEAPPPGAPARARLEAYKKNRLAGASVSRVVSFNVLSRDVDFVVLGDGRRVYHAVDLEPLVPAGSVTAESIRQNQRAERKVKQLDNIGWCLIVMGLAVTITAIQADSHPRGDTGPFFAAGLSSIGAGLAAKFASVPYDNVARDQRLSAFITYERDLRARLDLCIDGIRIVPCEVARAAKAAPAVAPTPAAPSASQPAPDLPAAAPEPAPAAPASPPVSSPSPTTP